MEIRILSPIQHYRLQQSEHSVHSNMFGNLVVLCIAAMITDDDNDESVNGHIKAVEKKYPSEVLNRRISTEQSEK